MRACDTPPCAIVLCPAGAQGRALPAARGGRRARQGAGRGLPDRPAGVHQLSSHFRAGAQGPRAHQERVHR